jgi:arylsulfatase A-like enzyme
MLLEDSPYQDREEMKPMTRHKRWTRICWLGLTTILVAWPSLAPAARLEPTAARPNILFAIADDWSWPHAGAYGDPVVKTPTFDRIARDGALFHHGYVSSPSCTPSRGAILTGQWHWRLGGAGNLWSVFPDDLATYPEILVESGYAVGVTGKGWGPGRPETAGRALEGKRYRNFEQFLAQRPQGTPFCFWLGSSDPHRPYKRDSGAASGIPLEQIVVPACFPDNPVVRGDVADYFLEVQRFDALVGSALEAIEQLGELDNTLVVMTSDNGMPFPRCKSNLYDMGARMPLAASWPVRIPAGQVIEDFVSLTDFAPTFLEAAELEVPPSMTGRSLLGLLSGRESGNGDAARDFVLVGKERHVPGQEAPDMGGYPCRGLRTHDFLYLRNFEPDRWPSGTPNFQNAAVPGAWLADCDNGPTKTSMVEARDQDPQHKLLYDLAFAKRPAEELYDLRVDPDQLRNVAGQEAYRQIQRELAAKLIEQLRASGDPRIVGGVDFDAFPYLGGAPKHPDFRQP